MRTNKTNILSYFIKDIKDSSERSNYKQKNGSNIIKILYKDKILYKLNNEEFIPNTIYNYKNNNMKCYYFNIVANYKIEVSKLAKYKKLFFFKNNDIHNKHDKFNFDYIFYIYDYAKYLIKKSIYYKINNKFILNSAIRYYNGYKYIYKIKKDNIYKYKSSYTCIRNKYELHYNNRFFNLFFGPN